MSLTIYRIAISLNGEYSDVFLRRLITSGLQTIGTIDKVTVQK